MPAVTDGPARNHRKETEIIALLRRLEHSWSPEHWIYVGDGTLYLMRYNDEGKQAMLPGGDGGVDPEYIVATFGGIDADGGGW